MITKDNNQEGNTVQTSYYFIITGIIIYIIINCYINNTHLSPEEKVQEKKVNTNISYYLHLFILIAFNLELVMVQFDLYYSTRVT